MIFRTKSRAFLSFAYRFHLSKKKKQKRRLNENQIEDTSDFLFFLFLNYKTMADTLKDIPEFFETEIGESIAARTDALGK